jgi:hypothetical protein
MSSTLNFLGICRIQNYNYKIYKNYKHFYMFFVIFKN